MGLEILQQIQSELKAPKSQFNSFGGYKYRNCEDILEAVKPLCAKYGAVITCTDEIVQIGERYYVKATARFYGGEIIETTAFAREPLDKKGMDESQITGAASSYARKYALNGLFAIDDTKDADTLNNGQNAETKPQAAKKAAKDSPAPAKEPASKTLSTVQKKVQALAKELAGIKGSTAAEIFNEGMTVLKLPTKSDKELLKMIHWLEGEIAKSKPDELDELIENTKIGA